MLNRKFLMAAGCFALIVTPVFAAGLFPGFPTIGLGALCSSTSTGFNGQICTTTTPAGPSIVTGNETVPADTNSVQGIAPQTVRLPMASLNALPFAFSALTPSASTITITSASIDGGRIITSAATLTPTIAVILPPSAIDGQQFSLTADHTVNIFSITGATGDTVSNAPTSLTISTTAPFGYQWRYRLSNRTWFRLQ